MFYAKNARAVIIRLIVYLIATVLIFVGFWFSAKVKVGYLDVNSDGSFGKTAMVREVSWPSSSFGQLPDFLVVDNRLYLRRENIIVKGSLLSSEKKKDKAWSLRELHALRDKNPELKPYLKDLPPLQETIIQLKLN